METIDAVIGLELRVLRIRAKQSQPQVAEAIAADWGSTVHASTISAWENGTSPITLRLLSCYARAFGVGIGDILRKAGLDEAA